MKKFVLAAAIAYHYYLLDAVTKLTNQQSVMLHNQAVRTTKSWYNS